MRGRLLHRCQRTLGYGVSLSVGGWTEVAFTDGDALGD